MRDRARPGVRATISPISAATAAVGRRAQAQTGGEIFHPDRPVGESAVPVTRSGRDAKRLIVDIADIGKAVAENDDLRERPRACGRGAGAAYDACENQQTACHDKSNDGRVADSAQIASGFSCRAQR